MKRIYLSPPHLDGPEERFVNEAIASNWITTLGPQVDAFEREMCEKIHAQNAIALSSGTAGLHLSLVVLGVTKGDLVLCSDMTFAASVNAICYCGAEPMFIDSNFETWTMDPGLLNDTLRKCARRGKLPKAVMVVDLYGQAADYDRITPICQKYGVPIVEDAAEAVGATYGKQYAGTLGTIGVFSFNGNKIITTSGGGMMISDDKNLTSQARFLSTQARDDVPYYQHSAIGYNYRLSNLLAAVGRGQLSNLERKVERRKTINRFYRSKLAILPGIEFMPEAPYGHSNLWLTCITVKEDEFGASNEEIRLYLESHNIESRHLWKPMHMQPVFAHLDTAGGRTSEQIFSQGLCLPSGSGLEDDDLRRITDLIVNMPRKEMPFSRSAVM